MSNVYHKSRMAEKKRKYYLEHRTSIENDVILAGGKEIQKGSLHAVVFCLDKDRATLRVTGEISIIMCCVIS